MTKPLLHFAHGNSFPAGVYRQFLDGLRDDFDIHAIDMFGHAKKEVFERYRDMGIDRLRTDDAGAIVLQFGAQVKASSYRTEHQRYWYGR